MDKDVVEAPISNTAQPKSNSLSFNTAIPDAKPENTICPMSKLWLAIHSR